LLNQKISNCFYFIPPNVKHNYHPFSCLKSYLYLSEKPTANQLQRL
jgi:hypothetical protein